MKKLITFIFLNCLLFTSNAQTITQAEYFIDVDNGFGENNVVAWQTPFSISLPVAGLTEGFHQLYFRTKDSDNRWSHTSSHLIEVVISPAEVVSAEYFFKTDLGFGACRSANFAVPAADGSFSFNIPLADIPADSDTLFLRVKNSPEGVWSLTALKPVLITVPVSLLDFIAVKQKQQVHLNWTTENETNSDHYNIERGTDGANFETVGRKVAKGSGASRNNYDALDDVSSISSDKIFYRLEIVDKDGRSSFSEIRTIKMDSRNGSLVIMPNPAQEFAYLIMDDVITSTPATVVISDLSGRNVANHKMTNGFLRLNTNTLIKGMYFVTATTPGQIRTGKLIIR